MRYADPITQVLNVVDNGNTYSIKCYKPATTITGVVDENHPNYSATQTYNIGDFVIVPGLKRIYKCAGSSILGIFPPANTTVWTDFGFVNSYRMFAIDENIGFKTIAKDMYLKFPFSQLDTIGVVDMVFESLTIKHTNLDTDETITIEVSGVDIGCSSFADYFYAESVDITRVIIDNFEWLPNASLELIFSGDVEIDTFVIGNVQELGVTLYGTRLDLEDRSKIKDDSFTDSRTVIRYGHVRVLSAKLIFDVDDFNVTSQKVSRIIGKNILYIPTDLDTFNEMTNLAYMEKLSLPVDNPHTIQTDVTLIGVTKQ